MMTSCGSDSVGSAAASPSSALASSTAAAPALGGWLTTVRALGESADTKDLCAKALPDNDRAALPDLNDLSYSADTDGDFGQVQKLANGGWSFSCRWIKLPSAAGHDDKVIFFRVTVDAPPTSDTTAQTELDVSYYYGDRAGDRSGYARWGWTGPDAGVGTLSHTSSPLAETLMRIVVANE